MTAYPYPYLMDAALDGYIEDQAWVAGDLADTAEEAVAVLIREWPDGHPLQYDDQWPAVKLVGIGKRTLLAYARGDQGADWPRSEEEITGEAAEALLKTVVDDEGLICFRDAEPGTPGSREWWLEERVECCGKWIETEEIQQCLLDVDHEGDCAVPA